MLAYPFIEVINMLINEVSKATGLSKKAIEYYAEQSLIIPNVLENGYREFGLHDVEMLNKISVLRKLGIGVNEIKVVLDDETGESLRKLTVQKKLGLQKQQAKQTMLNKLSSGSSYCEINEELQSIEDSATIAEKILEAFPGYYGRFICLHFARFLNEPILTQKQKSAYDRIISFLDNAPSFTLPEGLKEYLIDNTKHISTEQIADMVASTKKSIEHPDEFVATNKEVLEQYLAFKQSDEYKNSPVFQIQSLLKDFNGTSGYYDVFIPALKELSPSYADYYKQLEIANEKLLAEYPDIEKMYGESNNS